jgi:hypothetical protein
VRPAWLLLIALSACSTTEEPRGDLGGDRDDLGGDPDTGFAELALCLAPDDCALGLECAELGVNSYCLRPCGGGCGDGWRCDETGYCLRAAVYFEPCGRFDACSGDAFCGARAPGAPARCVPICDVGDLAGKTSVVTCPPLPAGFTAGAVRCAPGVYPGTNASMCVADVAIGERCDELALRCNPARDRADGDDVLEEATDGGPDPGAPSCLQLGTTTVCARVCTLDGGTSTSPCDCPAGDVLCADPVDPGLDWACVHWSPLAADLGACAPVEDCTSDAGVCADNSASGLDACTASAYEEISGSVCD